MKSNAFLKSISTKVHLLLFLHLSIRLAKTLAIAIVVDLFFPETKLIRVQYIIIIKKA